MDYGRRKGPLKSVPKRSLAGPNDDGSGVGVVNQSTFEWASENLPLFDCDDEDLVSAYYYRAKSYKSHMMRTDWVDIKHVSSEFGPTVPWGGVYGTINAAAGHQVWPSFPSSFTRECPPFLLVLQGNTLLPF